MVSLEHIKCNYSLPKEYAEQLNIHGVPFGENLSGVNIPVYKSSRPITADDCSRELFALDEEQTLLDSVLLAKWEEFSWKGLIRYDVTSHATRVVGGEKSFVARVNEHWNFNLLETENIRHPQLGKLVCNDLSSLRENILFCFTTGDQDSSELILSAPVPKDSVVIILNEAPIEYGHVFLLPYNLRNRTNFLGSLESIIRIATEVNNCSFRVIYNSPSSSNSNHMYFEACYFSNDFAVESMPIIPICNGARDVGIGIYEIANYPIKALMFSTKHNFKILIEVVSEICSHLTDQIARYNLLVSDNGRKVYLFLQAPKPSNDYMLSAWECGGHFVYNAIDDFNKANEGDIIKRMAAVSLHEEGFRAVKQLCIEAANNKLFPLGRDI